MNENTKKSAKSPMQHAWKILLVLLCIGLLVGAVSAAPTTSVEISRIAADGTTVLANETVTFAWMKENLPITGDGVTHYGHQGPVFDEASGYYGDPWDPQEIINTDDAGALRGTSVLDLASLVGGIPEESTVKIIAKDGLSRTFSSSYILSPESRMGPLVLVWEVNGVNVSAAASGGDASNGMRIYFFADDHVFGNYDMLQTMPESDRYNYSNIYPSTRGLSVQYVDRIKIYTDETEYIPTPTPTETPTPTPTVTPTPGPTYDLAGFDRVITIDNGPITIPADTLGSSSTLKTDTPAGNNSVAAMVYNTFGSDVTFWKGGMTGDKFNLDTLLGKAHKNGGYWYLFVNGAEQSIANWASDLTITSGQVVELVYDSDTSGVANFTVRMKASDDPMYIYDNVLDIGKTGTFTETINGSYEIPWYSPAGILKSLDFDAEYRVTQNGILNFNSFTDLQTGKVYTGDWINAYNAADLTATLPVDAEILPGDVIYIQFGGDKNKIEGSTAVIRAEVYAAGKTATWPLFLNGAVDIPLDKEYFEADASTHARVTYTDTNGDVWSGVPLRVLVGMTDDIESVGVSHYTFNSTRAAAGYTITLSNGDGTTSAVNANVLPATRNADKTYTDDYLIADTLNGVKTALTFVGSSVPAKLTDVRSIDMDVSAFEPATEVWSINLFGNINGTLADTFLYQAVDSGCAPTHNVTYTDSNGDVYYGMGMSTILGWVDDEHPHSLASETLAGGVTITFANDAGQKTTVDSDLFKDDTKKAIIAVYKNGAKITPTFIGEVVDTADRITDVSTITFTNYRNPPEIEGLTVIRKTADGTILNQTYISWQEMRDTFPVIGNGTYNYSIQGPIMPDYIGEYGNWDENEQFPPCGTADDPRFKVNDQVKGTAIINLTDLVGGMDAGDQFKIISIDGRSKTFTDGYRYLYSPDPKMGTMFLAWSDDGIDGPAGYGNLFRLYMTSDDNIFSLWDMHESMAEDDWGFYAGTYPTPADFSVYKINKLEIIVSDTDFTYEYAADTGEVEIPAAKISGSDVPKTAANNSLIGAIYNTLDGAELYFGVKTEVTYFNLNSYDGHTHKSPSKNDKWYAYINEVEVTDSEWDKVTVSGGQTVRLFYDDTTNGAAYNYSIEITAPDKTAVVVKGNVTIPKEQITAGIAKEVDNASVIGVLYNTFPGMLFYYGGDTATYFNVESYEGNTHKKPSSNDKWSLSINGVTLGGKTDPDWSLVFVEDKDFVSLTFDNQTAGTKSCYNLTIETAPVGTVITIVDGEVVIPAADISGSDVDVSVPGSSLIGVLSGIEGVGFYKGGNQGAYFNLDSYEGHTHKKPTSDKWYVSLDGAEVTEPNWTTVSVSDGQLIRLFFDEVSTGNSYEYLFTAKGGAAPGWSVKLINGETQTTLTQKEFETLAKKYTAYNCTDEDGVWKGVPLYVLAGIVDDEDASSFNENLANIGYSIRITDSQDKPYSTNFDSAVIANDNTIIVSNTLNGDPLPELTTGGKPCAPLQMKGVSAGQLIGNIGTIELIDVPEEGNLLFLSGKMERYLTQEQYDGSEHHFVTFGGYEGMPLYTLVSTVDDVESGTPGTYAGGHFTLNTTLISTAPYTILITNADGQTREIASSEIVSGKTGALNYIIAQKDDGSLILTGNSVSTIFENVRSIELKGEAYQGDDWYILLNGPEFGVYVSKTEIEEMVGCEWHYKAFTDPYTGEVWSGMTLASLVGYVDDSTMPIGSNHGGSFNLQLAQNGYTIILTAADGYSAEVDSKDLADNKNGFIIANKVDGQDLFRSENLKENKYPLRLVGSETYLNTGDAKTSKFTSIAVGGLVKIELKEFAPEAASPKLTIQKYDPAGNIVASEEVLWSTIWSDPTSYPVIGDGVTKYSFQGLVMEEDGEKIGQGLGWDLEEKYLADNYKVSNAVKGTAVQDLTDIVGGMNATDEIKFICSLDGWTTTLNYSNIYTPTVRQGTAFLAWYADGKTVPEYSQGPRLFFTSDDNVFSHADMYYSLDESYWHYNSGRASAGGISAQMVDVIKIIPKAESWTIGLNGAINETIDKGYFEAGLTCTFANGTVADHQAYYTDAKGRVWAGMPLWILTGFVDDENSHVGNSYNRTLALEGYNITVVGEDGSTAVISSRDAFMNNNYIVANTLNGTLLGVDDGWPLRLVGANVTGAMQIKGIQSIDLDLQPAAEKELEYDSTVVLRNTTLSVDVSGKAYDVQSNTVLGVILEAGLEPVIGTKKWDIAGILLFDGLVGYENDDHTEWVITVNNETAIDGYNDETKSVAVNIYEVKPGDVITGKFIGNDGVTVSQEFSITVEKPQVLTIGGPSVLISGVEGTYSFDCPNAAKIMVDFGDGAVQTYTAVDGAVIAKHTYTPAEQRSYQISAAAYSSAGGVMKDAKYSVMVKLPKAKPAAPVVTNTSNVISTPSGNATQISSLIIDGSDLIAPGAIPAILVTDNSSDVPASGSYGQVPENAGLLAVLNISLTNVTNPDNLNYTATFQVFLNKTAVDQLTGNDPTKITAYRNTLVDSVWTQVPLKTTYNQTADTAAEYAYDVETPGFSYFTFAAAAASSSVVPVSPPSSGGDSGDSGSPVTSTPVATPTSTTSTPVPTQTKETSVQTQTPTPTLTGTTAKPTQTGSPVPIFGLLAGLGIGALILRRR